MKLPALTNKQQELLRLLYRYRFLNRAQLQALMGHTDKRRIAAWLKDLRTKHYVEWLYDPTDFVTKTKPATYYLGINGIRFLRTLDTFPMEELRKRYREAARSQSYIERCLLIADCCLSLEHARTEGGTPESWYYFETEADYHTDSYYHFLADSELIRPDLCFSKEYYDGGSEPIKQHTYFLKVFDANYPRYRLQKRLKDYITFLDDGEWEGETGEDKAPIILLVCPRTTDLIYAKRRTRGLFTRDDIQDGDTPEEERLHIRFTTVERLQQHGVMAGIWEEA